LTYTLYIGNKNYSSWSLRPWLAMKHARIPFAEKLMMLDTPEFHAQIGAINPARRVPCLYDGEFAVWDTLAICEYLAERHPGLWPHDAHARARARSLCAEMHAGFATLRNEMPMNVRARARKTISGDALKHDVARMFAIWNDTRQKFGQHGALLFGAFSIADAFFAPVAFRFQTYGVEPPGAAGDYLRALLSLPAMREWQSAAESEAERLQAMDTITAAQVQQQQQ
jgi:glutathione S-transferase